MWARERVGTQVHTRAGSGRHTGEADVGWKRLQLTGLR